MKVVLRQDYESLGTAGDIVFSRPNNFPGWNETILGLIDKLLGMFNTAPQLKILSMMSHSSLNERLNEMAGTVPTGDQCEGSFKAFPILQGHPLTSILSDDNVFHRRTPLKCSTPGFDLLT